MNAFTFGNYHMFSQTMKSLILIGSVASVLAGWPDSAQAVEIRDDAGFFSRKALDQANARIVEIEKNYGKEIRIETFKAVPAGKTDAVSRMTKSERAGFFEKWARDRATAERVKGIYILICKSPGHVQVEEDRQTRNQGFGLADRNELSEKLLAGFRHKDYDGALLDSIDFVNRTMKAKLNVRAEADGKGAAPGRADHHDVGRNDREAGRVDRPQGMGLLEWLIVGVLIFLGVRLIIALFRAMSGGNRPAGGGYGGGYAPGPGGYGGGGGMMGGLMSGMFGAFAGNWLYNSFFGNSAHGGESSGFGGSEGHRDAPDGAGEGFLGSGGDFDNSDDDVAGGGGDSGDGGSGDFGGGDSGGGDFGGGDSGGGGDF
jgi:hypothetical protein